MMAVIGRGNGQGNNIERNIELFQKWMESGCPERALYTASEYWLGIEFERLAMRGVYDKFLYLDPETILYNSHVSLLPKPQIIEAALLYADSVVSKAINAGYCNTEKEWVVRNLHTKLDKLEYLSQNEISEIAKSLRNSMAKRAEATKDDDESVSLNKMVELVTRHFKLDDVSRQDAGPAYGKSSYDDAMSSGRYSDAAYIAATFGGQGLGDRTLVEAAALKAIEDGRDDSLLSISYRMHLARRFDLRDKMPKLAALAREAALKELGQRKDESIPSIARSVYLAENFGVPEAVPELKQLLKDRAREEVGKRDPGKLRQVLEASNLAKYASLRNLVPVLDKELNALAAKRH